MKTLLKFRKLVIVILLIIIIAVPASVLGYQNYNFNKLYNTGSELLKKESFDEAISAFNNALKYKPNQKTLVESKIKLSKDLKDSRVVFESAVKLESGKKYLDAIAAFKKVKQSDIKRYSDAQNKIKECNDNYIKENIDNAKNEASNKNFEKAITYLDTILKFDTGNKIAQSLKDEYNNEIQQAAAEAKKAEDDRIAAEKEKLAAQNTVKATSNTTNAAKNTTSSSSSSTTTASAGGNEVIFNNNLNIRLTGGDPILGRSMTLGMSGVHPDSFDIYFQVIQGGFSSELDYDITLYLVGRTVKYSGKTAQQFVYVPSNPSEVPKGENIKIVIDFKVNGKTYTTTGYRVLNNTY
ncbi:MAG: hypothetical protein Q8936_05710 [Bacillota bacterium]|nr:hypothetical protein [Bacillota bacterium]